MGQESFKRWRLLSQFSVKVLVQAFIFFYPITIMQCSAQYLCEECTYLYHDIEYVLIRNSHTLNHSRFFLGKILCFKILLNFVTLVNKKNAASYIFVFYIPHMCGGRVKAFKISFPAFLLRCCLIPRVPEQGNPASPQACHNLTANQVNVQSFAFQIKVKEI